MSTTESKLALPWAVAVVILGVATAMVSATFFRERRDAVAAEKQIHAQELTISTLNAQIEQMNRDIRSMQEGIKQMQREIVLLRKGNP